MITDQQEAKELSQTITTHHSALTSISKNTMRLSPCAGS